MHALEKKFQEATTSLNFCTPFQHPAHTSVPRKPAHVTVTDNLHVTWCKDPKEFLKYSEPVYHTTRDVQRVPRYKLSLYHR